MQIWRYLTLGLVVSSVGFGISSGGGAPEIDPSSAASAIVLLSGGVFLLVDKRFRKRPR